MPTDLISTEWTQREIDILPSAARTATPNSQQFVIGRDFDGITVVVDMTAVTATGTVTVALDAIDPTSGKAINLLTSAALSTVATTVLKIHPSLAGVANVTAQNMIPGQVRITATHGNAVSMTYSIGAWLS